MITDLALEIFSGLKIEVIHDLGVFADRTGQRYAAAPCAAVFEARQAGVSARCTAGRADRLANTWRTGVYPLRGESWRPTVRVWSNAPMLAAAHADGGTIVPKAASFGPFQRKASGGRRPLDIESECNQDLMKPTRIPNVFLALVRAVQARSVRSFEAPPRAGPRRTAGADVHPGARLSRAEQANV
jgi:hypothetical protein